MSDAIAAPEKLYTCIARCRVAGCREELNRAEHVPESAKTKVALCAPLVAICEKPGHSTFSDCNIRVDLEWIEETADA